MILGRLPSGSVVDRAGNTAGPYASVIYTQAHGSATPDPARISADAAGAVIDTHECLDLEVFREAYARIAQAKKLTKTPAPVLDGAVTTVTLGIIYAQRSAVPLEDIADELDRLNRQTSSRDWPALLEKPAAPP